MDENKCSLSLIKQKRFDLPGKICVETEEDDEEIQYNSNQKQPQDSNQEDVDLQRNSMYVLR